MNVDAGVIGNTIESYYETTGNSALPGVGTSTGGTVTIGGIADMTNPTNFTAWTDFGGHGSGQTWVTIGASGDIDESGALLAVRAWESYARFVMPMPVTGGDP